MYFREIILHTASVLRTRLFYHKTLELPIVNETDDTITFKAGSTLLTFKHTTEKKPYYHIAFNITNNKFSDSFEWMNSKLDILPTANDLPIMVYNEWNAESFYFYDNNGSILEFIVRFDLPYHSTEPFSPSDIREVSEVGIVTDNVTETAGEFHSRYGIPYFAKSKASDHFAAMGDDYGLLIIIPAGHHWVPTNKPARRFPITVVAANERSEQENEPYTIQVD
jgi:catechol-2,3-dioxygenase